MIGRSVRLYLDAYLEERQIGFFYSPSADDLPGDKVIMNTSSNHSSTRGLTLVELLIATLVMIPVCLAILYTFFQCMEYNDLARNSSIAVRACQQRMAQIENTSYGQIFAACNNVSFTATGINGRGVSYVDNSNPQYLKLTTSFSWRQKSGRVIGEDTDLDGVLDAGEDKNANGILDSTVLLTTYKYNM
jgi:hypothetical protein